MQKIFCGCLTAWLCFCVLAVKAQEKPLPASVVVSNAVAKAGAEHKNVFVLFHASWCSWCHLLDTVLADSACRQYFDDNYVIEHIDVMELPAKHHLENPGGDSLLMVMNGFEHLDDRIDGMDSVRKAQIFQVMIGGYMVSPYVMKNIKHLPGGLPFYAILDTAGHLLTDSRMAGGASIGYPTGAGWTAFEKMLKVSSHMTAQQLAVIKSVADGKVSREK